jgi:exosome complex component RRP42
MNEIINTLYAEEVKNAIKAGGQRLDKRKLDEFRKIEIKKGGLNWADGSAIVKIGDTEVICGIKFEIGEPYPDSPDQGSMTLNIELTGIASPEYFTGPPTLEAMEYGRIADRVIRSAEIIDFKDLCIIPGEKVLLIFIDCYAINAAGNIIDATEIASICALLDAKIPKIDENNKIIKGEYSDKKLNIKKIPLSFTFEKIENKIVLDPTDKEEDAGTTRFSIGICEDKIVSCQKSKSGTFTQKEILEMTDIALKKYGEIKKEILKYIKM